jgi:hypothetical protein
MKVKRGAEYQLGPPKPPNGGWTKKHRLHQDNPAEQEYLERIINKGTAVLKVDAIDHFVAQSKKTRGCLQNLVTDLIDTCFSTSSRSNLKADYINSCRDSEVDELTVNAREASSRRLLKLRSFPSLRFRCFSRQKVLRAFKLSISV